MNQKALSFFQQHYAPGRIGLVGARDAVGMLIRNGQRGLTADGNASKWSHTFIFGDRRNDGRSDGSIYIFESDLRVDPKHWQVLNGAMESRVVKWCGDEIDNACVLGMNLTPQETSRIVSEGLRLAYDDQHLQYPVGELFGTLLAILTGRMGRRNVFDDRYAVQCATYVRMTYQVIGKDPLTGETHISNTSPEKLYQSTKFTFRQMMS